ncbi:MAG: alpha/beta hydrolase [Eubacteriales bacterium]|jgi:pimeloyl-ACP methyl ester carboxylesterase|nr:alpha/beta hydrolase [Eubacteriales bacterium]
MNQLKVQKWILIAILVLIILFVSVILVFRLINTGKYKVSGNDGTQESGFVSINDCEIYVQIRGQHISNPVIVFVHGGPGFPLTYLSAYHQSFLEDDYTFVNYDQRHSGRSYYQNESTTETPTVHIMLSELDQIVAYTKQRLGTDKVIIMGQSWGTVLGSIYTQQHPENVRAYIGTGQVIDFDMGKIVSGQNALEIAKANGDTENAAVLEEAISTFEKVLNIDDVDIENLESLILSSMAYLRSDGEMSRMTQLLLGITSPFMNLNDIRWFLNASSTRKIIDLEKHLINYMYFEFDVSQLYAQYDVPVYYIQRDSDYITPTEMVEAYCGDISAPQKQIIQIENTGHTPFLDNPAAFAQAVLYVLGKN